MSSITRLGSVLVALYHVLLDLHVDVFPSTGPGNDGNISQDSKAFPVSSQVW